MDDMRTAHDPALCREESMHCKFEIVAIRGETVSYMKSTSDQQLHQKHAQTEVQAEAMVQQSKRKLTMRLQHAAPCNTCYSLCHRSQYDSPTTMSTRNLESSS